MEAGVTVKDLCRRHEFSKASYYLWRSKFKGHDGVGREAVEGAGTGEYAAEVVTLAGAVLTVR